MSSIPYPTQPQPLPAVYRVNVRAIWRYLRTQPASFWLVNFYLFLEYVRPQAVWPVLDVIPWAQITLIVTTAALLLEGKIPSFKTAAGGFLLFFSLVVVASLLTAYSPPAAFSGWVLYFSWVLIYLLITNIVVTETRFFIFMLAFLLYSFKMSQHGVQTFIVHGGKFVDWGATGAPGWFQNSGEFGIQMCVFLPLVTEFTLAFRKHWAKWTRWFFYMQCQSRP